MKQCVERRISPLINIHETVGLKTWRSECIDCQVARRYI